MAASKSKNFPGLPAERLDFQAGKPPAGTISIIPFFAETEPSTLKIDDKTKKQIKEFLKLKSFSGKSSEVLDLAPSGVILFGLGKKANFHADTLCGQLMSLASRIQKYESKAFTLVLTKDLQEGITNAQVPHSPDNDEETFNDYLCPLTAAEVISQAIKAMILGSDSMESLKSKKPEKIHNRIYVQSDFAIDGGLPEAVKRGETLGNLTNRMRYVQSLPGNYFDPEIFEQYATSVCKNAGITMKVFSMAQLEKMGCGGIVSVGKGSKIPPRMIVAEYKHPKAKNKKPIALVGKGITFDTGGISIKPAGEMHEMKFDMCGAALVLHSLALASERKLPVHAFALLGIAENMPGGNATKPGDVFTAYNGVTVENQNTDAEGRLVLADVLSYACKHVKPSHLFDFATLTGACIVALGHETAGVMTGDETLAAKIDSLSRRSLDRTWRLPHWKQYGQGLKSDIADLRNVSGRDGGTISAYRFLSRFVDIQRWAHFDIAGIAWHSKAFGSRAKGASGWGLSFLDQFFEDLIENQ